MKNLLTLSVLFVILSGISFSQSVQDFKIINKTGALIYDLYVSSTDNEEWGEDMLGVETLADGEEIDIEFAGYSDSECVWDVMIGDTEGNYWWLENVNLCELHELTFTADNKKEVSAETE